MLHYYAKEFFAPVIITLHVSAANEVQLYVVSDKLIPIRNCKFAVNTYKWNSLTPIHSQSYSGITIVRKSPDFCCFRGEKQIVLIFSAIERS